MKTILVVDDEQELAAVAVFVLARAGYEVHEAHTAQAALELLHQRPVDLVVTDIMMPGMTGLELAEVIRRHEHLAVLKVLAMSAAPESTVRSMGDQFDDFLPKPFQVNDLLQRVSHLLSSPC